MPVPPPAHAKCVFHGVFHDIWQWEQELFDGSRKTFECATRPDTVAVIAFLDPQTILLTQQEQPGRPSFMDVAGGRIDEGESIEEAAHREFLEETGYRIGALQTFRSISMGGALRLVKTTCLAHALTVDPRGSQLEAGERIALRPTPWQEAVQLSLQNKLRSQDAMLAILAMEFDPDARKIKDAFLAS